MFDLFNRGHDLKRTSKCSLSEYQKRKLKEIRSEEIYKCQNNKTILQYQVEFCHAYSWKNQKKKNTQKKKQAKQTQKSSDSSQTDVGDFYLTILNSL